MSMSHLATLIDEIIFVVVLATGEQSRSPKQTLLFFSLISYQLKYLCERNIRAACI